MVVASRLPYRHSRHRPAASRTDWRAVIITVAAHVALLLGLLASPYGAPLRREVAQMILVDLTSSDVASDQQQAVKEAHAAVRAHVPTTASAAPRREAVAAPTRAARVVDEGRETIVASGAASTSEASATGAATAAPLAGSAVGSDGRGEGSARGARFRPPRVLKRVLPAYPDEAYAQGRQGSVDVIVTVATDGSPIDASIYTSSGTPSLDRAAVAAVRSWTYAAATKNGETTQAQAIVTIDWSIAREMRLRGAPRVAQAPSAEQRGKATGVRNCLIRDAQHADLCR
ncbi:protein TonB [Dokdonella fugitiva]|uniref:Protein TonB n=1 Tax=Dokdonella fugitiva TaxID=328517 RepID=A0A839EWY1_9GAMM|nr:energy transducer TonB [Dokdonella fugitiva]MBA8887143.1 protein TonB [Dokdonella fugitiva]